MSPLDPPPPPQHPGNPYAAAGWDATPPGARMGVYIPQGPPPDRACSPLAAGVNAPRQIPPPIVGVRPEPPPPPAQPHVGYAPDQYGQLRPIQVPTEVEQITLDWRRRMMDYGS